MMDNFLSRVADIGVVLSLYAAFLLGLGGGILVGCVLAGIMFS